MRDLSTHTEADAGIFESRDANAGWGVDVPSRAELAVMGEPGRYDEAHFRALGLPAEPPF